LKGFVSLSLFDEPYDVHYAKMNISTLDLNYNSRFKALEGANPSTPKQTNFEVNFFPFKPHCVIKNFMTKKNQTLTLDLENTY